MEVRDAGARALEELGTFVRDEKSPILSEHLRETVPDLVGLLQDDSDDVRAEAARALGKLRFAEAVLALIQHINDKDDYVQVEIIRSLSLLGRSARMAIPSLLIVLQESIRPARETAAGALACIAPEENEVLQALCQALQDPDDDFRYAVAREFASMGEAASPALPYLIEALNDEHTGVYSWIVEALEHLGPHAREAIPHLKAIMNGPSPYRRQVAAKAMSSLQKYEDESAQK